MTDPKLPKPGELYDYLADIDPDLPDAALIVIGGNCQAEHCHCRTTLFEKPELLVEMMHEKGIVVEHALKTAITNVQKSPELAAARAEGLRDGRLEDTSLNADEAAAAAVWSDLDKAYEELKAKEAPIGCLLKA